MGLRRQKVSDPLEKYVAKLLETKKPREVEGILRAEKNPLSLSEIYKIRQRRTKARELTDIAQQFRAQLYILPPETILIDNVGRPGGRYRICPEQDVFRVVCKNLGYDTSEFTATKECVWIPPGHGIDVVVSLYGDLEFCYPVEEAPLFQRLLSSLPQAAREQFSTLKLDEGKYLAKCINILREIHNEASERTFQSVYEAGSQILSKLGPRPLEAEFGNIVYQLCIVYRRTSGEFGLPDKSHYQVRRRGLFFSELYLGQVHLASAPSPPPRPPGFPPLPDFLSSWADLHRDMIVKWSTSAAIIELLTLFEDLRGIEATIKQELDDIIHGK
jgi:hypothetical protein